MTDPKDPMSGGQIRRLNFVPRRGKYGPTASRNYTFTAEVDTNTGHIVERTATGWRAAPYAPPHDPQQVLAYLERERAKQAEADRARQVEREGRWARG